MTTIHIMTATLTAGDAIGNYSRALQRLLWCRGYTVRLYADLWDSHSRCGHSREFLENASENDVLWYHYSIYSDNVKYVRDWPHITVLDYHGVTPPSLFHGYSEHLENLCRRAREELPSLVDHVDLAIAHSDYTLSELCEAGFSPREKIPLIVETTRFVVPENNRLTEVLQSLDYFLFVGRITPQKSIVELIHAFALLQRRYEKQLFLLLVGEYSYSPRYVEEIRTTIAQYGLEDQIILTDKVAEVSSLKCLYRHALFSVYLSHWETFCVPIVESMYLGTPVIGLNKTAIPEVLGDGGILLDNHDPQAFVDKVIPFLENPDSYDALQSRAEKRAGLYTEPVLGKNLEDLVLPRFGSRSRRAKVAFVVQRYGMDVFGGAEYLCRMMAEHVNRHISVEIVTTCARDYHTWENHYPKGLTEINGIPVHRFPVEVARDMEDFTAYSRTLFEPGVHEISFSDSMTWMRRQGPRSRGLLQFIESNGRDYDFIFFYTYLYASTVFGLPLVRDKAILVPTAHNEPPIYLKIFRDLFRSPRGIIYLTEPERQFVLRLYRNHAIPSVVAGVGIDEPPEADPDRFRKKYGIDGPFLLYVGRIARSKGCQELLDMFCANHERFGSVKLVLIGKEMLAIPEHPAIRALGFVDEQDKTDAMAAATVTVNPSPFESLSFSLLESWILGTPTLVNARCDVLADHTQLGGGGLAYKNEAEFVTAVSRFLGQTDEAKHWGEQGRSYVRSHFTWDRVEGEIINFLSELHNPTRRHI